MVSATLLYIFVILLSVTAYPPEYDNWLAYIRDLDTLSGIGALPAFYAAQHYLGATGVRLLMVCLLALIVTSLIGNTHRPEPAVLRPRQGRHPPEGGFSALNRQENLQLSCSSAVSL